MSLIQQSLTPFKNEFIENGCVKLPSFLNPFVLETLREGFNLEAERRFLLDGGSTEYTVDNPALKTKLHVIFNSSEFLDELSAFIGMKINFTKHRLYYIDENCVSLPWHDDSYAKDTRIAAMRFELSETPYVGGDFLFKNSNKEYRFHDLKFGESVIFQIKYGKSIHRVTPVTSGIRRSLSMFLCE